MKNELTKLARHESLRENYEKACAKFVRGQAQNLEKQKFRFEKNSLLWGFRIALRKIYEEIDQEKELVAKKMQEFEKADDEDIEEIEDTKFAFEKKRKRDDFMDIYDKVCYEFAKKEIGIWRIYGYMPEKGYMLMAFEDALGKFVAEGN